MALKVKAVERLLKFDKESAGRWRSSVVVRSYFVLLLNYYSTNLSFGKAQTSLALLSFNRFVHSNKNNRYPS